MKKAKRREVKRFAWEMGEKSVESTSKRGVYIYIYMYIRFIYVFLGELGGSDRNNKYSV